ncbi:MAG: hypothetical protein ACP5K3_02755 [Candidatus Micrarchaeia archaeon]
MPHTKKNSEASDDSDKIIEQALSLFEEKKITYPHYDEASKKIVSSILNKETLKKIIRKCDIPDSAKTVREMLKSKAPEKETSALIIANAIFENVVGNIVARISNINAFLSITDEEISDIDFASSYEALHVFSNWMRDGLRSDLDSIIKEMSWEGDVSKDLKNFMEDLLMAVEFDRLFSSLKIGDILDYSELVAKKLKERNEDKHINRAEFLQNMISRARQLRQEVEAEAQKERDEALKNSARQGDKSSEEDKDYYINYS